MPQTSRELVSSCLEFDFPERIPRDMWTLPWVEKKYPHIIRKINNEFPADIITAPAMNLPSPLRKGNPYAVGKFVDEWGCIFLNLEDGIEGQLTSPICNNIFDWQAVQPPYDILPPQNSSARDKINRFCTGTDKFVKAACCPRPWERYQFLRGSENSYFDVLIHPKEFKSLLKMIHEFYLKELEFWVKTEVDAIMFMDDWGSQSNLLIPPEIWREFFKPLYKDYCDMAQVENKFVLMHSDGDITDIFQDIFEIGVNAINSQLFCMDMRHISENFKGKITFWGEIDRQHILPSSESDVVKQAVKKVFKHFYDPAGGIFAQFELGPGANPLNAFTIFAEWSKLENFSFRNRIDTIKTNHNEKFNL